jgi:hypothetical protein
MIKGRDNVLPRMDCTAMEIHSYQGSLDPLWISTARMGAPEEPVSVALPAGPSCDIKPAFLIAMLGQHGRKAAWGCGKPQPWRAWTAMEIHSYQGSLDTLRNSIAAVGVHSYGIPELVQTDSGVECTHRFPARRRIQSAPVPARFSHNSCMTALSHRPHWHGHGRVSAHDGRFSHSV